MFELCTDKTHTLLIIKFKKLDFDFFLMILPIHDRAYTQYAYAYLESLDVIHITLPVFDVAIVISRYHPVIIMTPYHSSN